MVPRNRIFVPMMGEHVGDQLERQLGDLLSGPVLPGVYDVLVSADEEAPDRIYIDVHECIRTQLLDAERRIVQAITGERVFSVARRATPAEWTKARELDRWFMIRSEEPDDELATLPHELRRFAQVAVEWFYTAGTR